MSYLIIIPKIQVENANTISGLTYGFPAITHFLGFTHALSRKVKSVHPLVFTGCGVICHQFQIQAHRATVWSDYSFALTRNPLTKTSKTAAFNEEGRMHITVTLFIECEGDIADDTGIEDLAGYLQSLCVMQRLAGGTIIEVGPIRIMKLPENVIGLASLTRREMCRALPGFVLMDRTQYLAEHFAELQSHDPNVEMVDAWLDFSTFNMQAYPKHSQQEPKSGDPAIWHYVPKPKAGHLVPIMTGYRSISSLYSPGKVEKTRDSQVPFCFAESVYSIGEWCGLHRFNDINQIFWRYHFNEGWYLCKQSEPQIRD